MLFALLLLLAVLCYFVAGVLRAVQCVVYAGLAVYLAAHLKPVSIRVVIGDPVTLVLLVLTVAVLVYYLTRRRPVVWGSS